MNTHQKNSHPLAPHILSLFEHDERSPEELGCLVSLMCLFADLPLPPDPLGLFPNYAALKNCFLESAEGSDAEILEEAFLALYCHVHGHEAPYTPEERAHVNNTGGYWCHAGGLSPILKAGPFIEPNTISGDFGAGNGLQAFLIQKLRPHKKTILIEISSRMVEAGKHLQAWLGIPNDRVEWVVGDVADTSPCRMDFIYLYRPVRPEGPGKRFYESFAKELGSTDKSQVIFSIADCLRFFLPPEFEVIYNDGHLTCFCRGSDARNRGSG
ncbi:MAG: class I SAM-dependent methyltransferase [Proteobacteria bacterium]|nr:class I SAM-dependent methyltransferase [Pseudomonadota bacterium]